MTYRTRQKDAVLRCLRLLEGRHATAAEVAAALAETGQPVGLSTVYRRLEQLVNEGCVKKFLTGDGSACFQYVGEGGCGSHFHLKCERCGKLIHLQCRTMDRLSEHILAEHGFLSDPGRTVLYGICAECRASGTETAPGGTEEGKNGGTES